jgi:hypothetical protein
MVLVLGIALFFMIRSKSVGIGPALVALFFGFFLAGTGAQDLINDFFSWLASTVNNLSANAK